MCLIKVSRGLFGVIYICPRGADAKRGTVGSCITFGGGVVLMGHCHDGHVSGA